jgi:hypothetical protein
MFILLSANGMPRASNPSVDSLLAAFATPTLHDFRDFLGGDRQTAISATLSGHQHK